MNYLVMHRHTVSDCVEQWSGTGRPVNATYVQTKTERDVSVQHIVFTGHFLHALPAP